MTEPTITEFLEKRLREDEEDARAADAEAALAGVFGDAFIAHESAAAAEHVARHDPARVLREIAAKRRVMERHSPVPLGPRANKGTPHSCAGCNFEYGDIESVTEDINECPELRDLAAVYSDHPDYREEWRP